jgi:surface antigen
MGGKLRRVIAAFVTVTALAVGGLVVGAAPASAASGAVLCRTYAECKQFGMTDHGYSTRTASYWRMTAGHNCTNYAAFLMVKAGMSRARPWNGNGNANAWGHYNDYDQSPAVGSIAWWDSNKNGVGALGHVAYVEAVLSPTEIVVSEDNWGGEFFWKVITVDDPRWPTGFIHFADSGKENNLPAYRGRAAGTGVYADAALRKPLDPTHLKPGSTAWVQVKYLNTGATTWTGLNLGTPGVDSSAIATAAWPSANRAATLRTPAATGETASFVVPIQIPAGTPDGTDLTTVFQPVSPASGWMRYSKATVELTADSRLPFTATPAPVVTGSAKEGQILTADAGMWAPGAPTLSYQWNRNGSPIEGATGARYAIKDPDVGTRLTVTVTGSATGYIPSSQTSAETTLVKSKWGNTLRAGSKLSVGQQLVSSNGVFRATQTASGKFAVVNRFTKKTVWSSGRVQSVKTKLRTDGNLVSYAASGKVVWQSKSKKSGAVRLTLTSTGKVVLYSAAGKQKWKAPR